MAAKILRRQLAEAVDVRTPGVPLLRAGIFGGAFGVRPEGGDEPVSKLRGSGFLDLCLPPEEERARPGSCAGTKILPRGARAPRSARSPPDCKSSSISLPNRSRSPGRSRPPSGQGRVLGSGAARHRLHANPGHRRVSGSLPLRRRERRGKLDAADPNRDGSRGGGSGGDPRSVWEVIPAVENPAN